MKSKKDIEFKQGLDYWIFFFICFFGISFSCISQNLVPNPSFEVYTYCPVGVGGVGNLPATPWRSATNGTPDYFNVCAVVPEVSVPSNGFGFQEAHTGMAYMGGILLEELPDSSSYREYLLAPLMGIGLLAGYVYQVSFYVSLGDNMCAIDKIGAYFSRNRPPGSINTPLDVNPQIESKLGIITDSINWVFISECFIAKGGERWITIGNFYDNEHTAKDPGCGSNFSYYFIDDVEVVKVGLPEHIDLTLGDTLFSCDSLLIQPHLTNVSYLWENGSKDSTLLVTTSGTYSLTVTDGCAQGIDSIDVIIKSPDTLDIGPSAITLCDQDSVKIDLDSSLGKYTWQDGFIGNEYTISNSGFYKVTLDNGACESADEMLVTSMTSPAPFSLGGDTLICEGKQLLFFPNITDVNYLWQDGSTNPQIEVTAPDTVILLISNDCGIAEDSVVVSALYPPPIFDLGPDTILCQGDSFLVVSPFLNYDILWQDGSHQPEQIVDQAMTYTLELSNACGAVMDSFSSTFNNDQPTIRFDHSIYWCENDTIILDATQPFEASYLWSTGSDLPIIQINSPGKYSIEVKTECTEVREEVEIVLDPSCVNEDAFYFPNVFSPNHDGINDIFYVYPGDGIEILSLEGSVFDRWGNLVYLSHSTSFSWDGKSRQIDVLPGVYTLAIRLKYKFLGMEKEYIHFGDITVIR